MGDRFWFRLVVGVVMLAAVAAVGVYSYNLGLAQGAAGSVRAVAVPGGFFPFFPLLFILFWVFVLRGLFWRGAWHRRACGYGGVPPAFDEWHRRAHAQQGQQGPPPPATRANV